MVEHSCEVVVVGGGLAGFATALGMVEAGFETILLAPDPERADPRTTALLGRSVAFLSSIGVFPDAEALGEAIETIRIIDDTGRLLRAPMLEFHAGEIGLRAFGFNVKNADLLSVAKGKAESLSGLKRISATAAAVEAKEDRAFITLDNGDSVSVRLVIGADGAKSLVRREAGIGFSTWSYPQQALVLDFSHEKPHGQVSTEFHTPVGPFTQVPLPGLSSSLVWVEEPKLGDAYVDLKPERLSSVVEEKLHSILGSVTVAGPVGRFPLKGGSASRVAAARSALVGEAAHVFPPIGAQGLNLGLRDAAAIIEAASANRQDPGSAAALARYSARRRADIWSRTAGVDALNRSLLADLLPVQLARTAGLTALSAIPPLKRMAMREGLSPFAGLMGLPRTVRDVIGTKAG
ncbi:UbiH/UbiF family hydroxylase [Consotaella salsifontis]|uniref:2-octaprenyl-3-methyl-6-methoxy-1,4-benzoquinol hydroxylase n=1 Tax=Consotaella salsifontis TaxID=1365950 RepID=A0A1T4SYT7_9HYPH|nr:UbiH/UbiF family hydroxylase [Consotaella salsifontis]SKA33393.1 2-octaprenyl-3-methyl-6-methoxy-1,4-benzoquinol hydroxylase [Consotaella salsifontis]